MNTFCTSDRKVWRCWLETHFLLEKEVWLVFPSKDSGEPGLLYNDAVEEALCFGWIDSTVKRLDQTHRCQRFTPRNPKSTYSRPNIERLALMERQGLIHPSVREKILPLIQKPFAFPEDILDEIRKDEAAWTFFLKCPESYKRIRIAYVDDARRRPEEFRKRLDHFLELSRRGCLIKGFGGIDKYYNL